MATDRPVRTHKRPRLTMLCLKVVIYFLFQTSAVFYAESNFVSNRSSYFSMRENKQLKGYVVKRVDSPSLLSCGLLCMENAWCTSTNYKMSSKKGIKGTCELNKHEISVIKENTNFDEQLGVTFSMLLKGCLMTSCLNGGSCLPGNEQQTYFCSCQSPWTGDRCEDLEDSRLPTCKDIYEKDNSSRQNKAYLLEIGSEKIPVFCHMNNLGACQGNGWTLVMKMNGSQRNFHFDSALWSNKKSFNLDGGKSGLDTQETKLPTYWNTPFSRICLGMKINNKMKYIVIDKQASSLYSLIADGIHRPTSLGRDTWKSLIGSQASLQSRCNQEGFNVVSSGDNYLPKARIGILGNNEKDCKTCDSRIGFGTGGKQDDSNACGNEASGGFGDTHIKAMGYILVL